MASRFKVSRYWMVSLAGLGVTIGAFFWVNAVVVPYVAERWLVKTVEKRGLEVDALPVKGIGLTHSRLKAGGIRMDPYASLHWEGITVAYRPLNLVKGQMDRIEVDQPEVKLTLSNNWWTGKEFPLSSAPEPVAGNDASSGSEAGQPLVPAAGGSTVPDENVVKNPFLGTWDSGNIQHLLAVIPFREMEANSGRLEVALPGGIPLSGQWDAQVLNGQDFITGQARLQTGVLTSTSEIRGIKSAGVLTLHSEIGINLGSLVELLGKVLAASGNQMELTGLDFPEPLAVDLLIESRGNQPIGFSAEARLESFTLHHTLFREGLRFKSLLAIATSRGERTTLDAGVRLGPVAAGDFQVDPFGLKFKVDFLKGAEIESESFGFSFLKWTGKGAIRGRLSPSFDLDRDPARLEFAFSTISGPEFQVEPASLLVKGNLKQAEFSLSPLGLKRSSTIWLEDIQSDWDLSSGGSQSSLTWYNPSGNLMGYLALQISRVGNSGQDLVFTIRDSGQNQRLKGLLNRKQDGWSLSVDGELPVPWINALQKWWSGGQFLFSGDNPRLVAELSGKAFQLKGRVRLQLPSSGLELADGLKCEGIHADTQFKLNELPQTDGPQTLGIDSITAGKIRFSDLRLDWEMPTFRHLDVEKVTAAVGGGQVSVNPFSFDPLDPLLPLDAKISRFACSQLMTWLNEKRFAIQDTTVSGETHLLWRQGTLFIRAIRLDKDASASESRFLFLDPGFLKEEFQALSSIPESYRKVVLDALLQDGIQIKDIHIELIHLEETGEVDLRMTLTGTPLSKQLDLPLLTIVIHNKALETALPELLGMVGAVRYLPEPNRSRD